VTVPGNVNTQTLPGRGRTPASLDTTKAKLISIAHENNLGVRTGVVEIGNSDWAFASCATTPFPGTPSSTQICLRNGFDPNLAYELVYTAKDPLVLGSAWRRCATSCRSSGTPGPPPATRSGARSSG